MKLYLQCLAIAAAGAVGAVSRFLIAKAIGRLPTAFPLGTFIINITGSFLLGWLSTYLAQKPELRLIIGVGFVGAYTTFSTFMFESDRLVSDGMGLWAALNLIGSVIVGLLAVRLGILTGAR